MSTNIMTQPGSAVGAYRRLYTMLATIESEILVVTHGRPDGDAIGSALAMTAALSALGKDVRCWIPDVPRYLRFMCEDFGPELTYNDDPCVADGPPAPAGASVVIAVDCGGRHLCALNKAGWPANVPVISIDHHKSNDLWGDENFVDVQAAAAAEIIWRTFAEDHKARSERMACAAYVGMRTDTGSFSYGLTTPATMRAAAQCQEAGADVPHLCAQLGVRERHEIELLSMGLANVDWQQDGKIACVTFRHAQVSALSRESGEKPQTQPLLALLRSTRGCEISATATVDVEEGVWRLSARSTGSVDVAAICQRFGGGGHTNAAGAKIPLDQDPQEFFCALADAL